MPKTDAIRSRRGSSLKRSPRPGAELAEFQQLVCNLAADLILNGGHAADTAQLVRATLGHSFRLRFRDHDAWLDNGKFLERELPEWLHRLSRHWPKEKAATPAQTPKTVSDMARERLRDVLRERFEEFLGKAQMHEVYLLEGVLETFESNANPTRKSAESTLAEAFMYELGSDSTYVKVSRGQVELVEEYVAGLSTIPDEGSSARPSGHLGRKDDEDDEDED